MSGLNTASIPVLLVFFISFPLHAADLQPSLQKHARIEAQHVSFDEQYSQDSPVLGWLEGLLTRIPTDVHIEASRDETRTDAIQDKYLRQEFEATVVRQEKPTAEPEDPVFPKPALIPPLYTSPALDGEGSWTEENLPLSEDGKPLMFKTVYRPSEEFPNAVVYMTVFDMNRLKIRFFLGQSEPGVYQVSHSAEHEDLSKIVAITNAMWMQQHAKGAGAVFRGQVVYPMVPGMATLVVYRDDSVDVVEWSDDIPLHLVKDARQLRHLIVKDGTVVEQILKNGKLGDSEIGLGGFLVDDSGRSTMSNKFWFLANRTAFGIREDGNLIFAMGHHVGTKDLAKALVLAGCKRAVHGDANIHNIVCNFYFRDERDKIVKREKLSPEQLKYTMSRYDQGYSKDFFAFYEK
ncbi:MAG TPA: hypothetical protein VK463_18465 [Desulfomonilaceae bacterium]|nr:hypothetical protein [Desulfomonilaceae bacterium]